ncbi:hypothetical protein PIB30_054566 [Stylosanthes scabra]|uniref:Uncharacterized protein n=1 Tax=Stylosanthes scabra TaxID=79078 RepID=A0ABU6TKE9_9FABA|nr:hypothetical protein [Stylosanthes scabra]
MEEVTQRVEDNGRFQTLGDSKIHLEENKEVREMLKRSLVGETLNPLNFEELSKAIRSKWHTIESVNMIGSMKMLMTFGTVEDMEEAEKSELLLNYFIEIRRWTTGEVNRIRRKWLEVSGDGDGNDRRRVLSNICNGSRRNSSVDGGERRDKEWDEQ